MQPSPTLRSVTMAMQKHKRTHKHRTNAEQYLIQLNFSMTKGFRKNSRDAINTNSFMNNVIRWVYLKTFAGVVNSKEPQACSRVLRLSIRLSFSHHAAKTQKISPGGLLCPPRPVLQQHSINSAFFMSHSTDAAESYEKLIIFLSQEIL